MRYRFVLYMLILFVSMAGCKKNNLTTAPLASLNVINASVGLGYADINLSVPKDNNPYYYWTLNTYTNYGSNLAMAVNPGVPVPMTIAPDADTLHPVFSGTFNFAQGGLYSLYLAGKLAAVDTIFVKENIPTYTDSSCGVRFINLSYNSNPIIVTQTATPTVVDFSSLAYKQMSAFKTYPALSTKGTYSFQVRDAASNAVLATYSLSTPRFFNCTLAWKGMVGGTGTNTLGVMRVNNY